MGKTETVETVESVVEPVAETAETVPTDEEKAAEAAEAAAAFNEGFTGTEPTAEKPPAEVVEPVEEEPKVEEPKYAQVTEDELQTLRSTVTTVNEIKATMEKQFGTAFGKMGGLERTIKEIQSQTPAGQVVEVSAEDFPELSVDFPELVKMQVVGLNRVLAKLKVKGTGESSADAVEKLVTERLEKVRPDMTTDIQQAIQKAAAFERLDEARPDWRTIIGEPEAKNPWREWLAKQPAAYKTQIESSWRPNEIKASIEKFEADTKPKPKPVPKRAERLAEAVNPRGAGGHVPGKSEHDAFNEGFNSP